MAKYRKQFSKEEKLSIVKQSLSDDANMKNLSEEYGIHYNTLSRWRREYLKLEKEAFPGAGNKGMTDSEREVYELKKRLKEAELERDILKKAISIFSKTDKKSTSS